MNSQTLLCIGKNFHIICGVTLKPFLNIILIILEEKEEEEEVQKCKIEAILKMTF